jgi:hypothetical protein
MAPTWALRTDGRAIAWLICAWLVTGSGWKHSRIPSLRQAFRIPSTPLDLTSPSAVSLWLFLKNARASVPEKASYTIHASQSDEEMTLFMMSRGIFESQEGLPTSDYGIPTPDEGRRAGYVLVYGRCPEASNSLRLVSESAECCVFQRNASG